MKWMRDEKCLPLTIDPRLSQNESIHKNSHF